jgi:hydroxyacylglutathione hydrolase
VRSEEELETAGRIPSAQHIHRTFLPEHLRQVAKDRMLHTFCGGGLRSMIAASLLQRAGWENLIVVLGGFSGWISTICELE